MTVDARVTNNRWYARARKPILQTRTPCFSIVAIQLVRGTTANGENVDFRRILMTATQPPSVAAIPDCTATGTKFTDIMLQDEVTRHMNETEATAKNLGTKHQFTDKQA
jgi:hypothetical protein